MYYSNDTIKATYSRPLVLTKVVTYPFMAGASWRNPSPIFHRRTEPPSIGSPARQDACVRSLIQITTMVIFSTILPSVEGATTVSPFSLLFWPPFPRHRSNWKDHTPINHPSILLWAITLYFANDCLRHDLGPCDATDDALQEDRWNRKLPPWKTARTTQHHQLQFILESCIW